jgi:hypothetical protein
MRKGIGFKMGADAGFEMLPYPFPQTLVIELLLGNIAVTLDAGSSAIQSNDGRQPAVYKTGKWRGLGFAEDLGGIAFNAVLHTVEPPVGCPAIKSEKSDLPCIRHWFPMVCLTRNPIREPDRVNAQLSMPSDE